MSGAGRAPKPLAQRRTRHKPLRGDWQATPGIGWQHGPIPDPPAGLSAPSTAAWTAWMSSWWAAHWTAGDLPMLELVIRLFDLVETGKASAALRSELRLLMDNYGISPKGRQDRRWQPPAETVTAPARPAVDRYAHLRTIDSRAGDASLATPRPSRSTT